MSEIVDFIKQNAQGIIIIVLTVLILLVLINIKGIDLNAPKPKSKLVQQVTVETFSQTNDDISNILANSLDNFCESYLGNSEELDKACNQLTASNCAKVKCCVFTNDKCLAGDSSGPTYKTDKDGKLFTIDSYYYLGKKIN